MRITFATLVADLSGGARVIRTYARAPKERGRGVWAVTRPTPIPLKGRVRSLLSGRGFPPRLSASSPFYDPAAYDYRVEAALRPIDAPEVPDADAVIATWWESRVGRDISTVHSEQSRTLKRKKDPSRAYF
jgi:hypothetical protein